MGESDPEVSERDYIALAAEYQAGVLDGRVGACKWVRLACQRNRRDLDRQDTPEFPYRFDPEAAVMICRMAEMLPHVKGPKAKQTGEFYEDKKGEFHAVWATIVLEPWQCWILTTLFGWKHGPASVDAEGTRLQGRRRFRVALSLIPRKNAKALALDTEIPTPDGFKLMGDLRVGDVVFGEDGRPARITAESPVMIGQTCYEVEFSTGERVVADAGHLWRTQTRVHAPGVKYRAGRVEPGSALGQERVRTTEEIYRTQTYGSRRDRNHSVKLAAPIDLPEVALPIDPYALGVWLGDGHSAAGRFTNADPEVVSAMTAIEGEVRMFARRGAAASYQIGRSYRDGQPAALTFQGRLRSMGLLNNKHVAVEYLRASRGQRLALLQGLMDTDGTISKAGQSTFVSTSQCLAVDACQLVASLGLKPSITSADAKIYGRVVGTAYRVQFWANQHTPVFRISRKLERQRAVGVTARSMTRQIAAVREVPSVPVKCITVDSPGHMFLVGRSFIPTHNSTLAAVVVLYMLVADGESGAECYSAATTRDQAKTIAEIVWLMAKRSPAFREYYGVRLGSETTMSLSVPENGSKFLPLSADANTLDSLNVSLAAIDELHAHRTAAVWNVLDTATGARLQPLIFAITTAGIDIGGVCHMKMGYLEKVLDGVFEDEAFFGINYTIDPGDDIRDPTVQRKANPNYGVSVDPGDLERKVHAAFFSPAEMNDKLTKHFNVWIRTESSWMTGTLWNTCGQASRKIEDYRAYPMWIGVDLAEIRDIASLMALFKLGPDRYAAFGRFYLPKISVDKSPVAQLSGWVREGHIIETDGDQADFKRIENDIVAWCDQFKVQEVDFDRALAAQMQQDLKSRFEPRMGRDEVNNFIVTVDQNVQTMDSAMKMIERLVLAGRLEHAGNPAMAWMISNVVVERNYKDEIYPRKAGGKDSANKIDGPVSLFTCLSQAMRAKEPEPSFRMLSLGGTKR